MKRAREMGEPIPPLQKAAAGKGDPNPNLRSFKHGSEEPKPFLYLQAAEQGETIPKKS
jgi:hypothetical protein